jgi:hypothetical protein
MDEEIIIDLSLMNESFMTQFSTKIRFILRALMTGSYFPRVRVKGSPLQLDRFSRALAAEKNYVTAFNQYGLNNPATYKSRYRLNSAVSKFERDTGLIWPFK